MNGAFNNPCVFIGNCSIYFSNGLSLKSYLLPFKKKILLVSLHGTRAPFVFSKKLISRHKLWLIRRQIMILKVCLGSHYDLLDSISQSYLYQELGTYEFFCCNFSQMLIVCEVGVRPPNSPVGGFTPTGNPLSWIPVLCDVYERTFHACICVLAHTHALCDLGWE